MQRQFLVFRAATAALLLAPFLLLAPALAQSPAPPATDKSGFSVTPGQVTAAEREFRDRAVSGFRAVSRSQDNRREAIRAALPADTVKRLGRTATLTPRTPYVENVAWLNAELVTSNPADNIFSMLVWADDFAPIGSFDVVINAQAGKRYLVECTAQSFGASATQATVYASDSASIQGEQLAQARHNVSAPGSVLSVVTPQTAGAGFLRVSIGVDQKAIDRGGLSVLVLDKCEVTPFT